MSVSSKHNSIIAFVFALSLALFSFQTSAGDIVSSGTFIGASDHVTTGTASVKQTSEGLAVVLGADFVFDGAPDPKVGFGIAGNYDISSQLAHLKSNTGEQVYLIPDTLNIDSYDEIYIWCEQYSVPLGVAKIK